MTKQIARMDTLRFSCWSCLAFSSSLLAIAASSAFLFLSFCIFSSELFSWVAFFFCNLKREKYDGHACTCNNKPCIRDWNEEGVLDKGGGVLEEKLRTIGTDLGVFRVIVDTRIGPEWFPRLPRSLDDLYKEGSHLQLFSLAGAEPLISFRTRNPPTPCG